MSASKTVSPGAFAKLAQSTALLAYSSEPSWNDTYLKSLVGASRILVRQKFFLEAIECAYKAATVRMTPTYQAKAIFHFRSVCKEIFKRGGFQQDTVAQKAIERLVDGIRNCSYRDFTPWVEGPLKDLEGYAGILLADGRVELLKSIAERAATSPMRSWVLKGSDDPLVSLGKRFLKQTGQTAPAAG